MTTFVDYLPILPLAFCIGRTAVVFSWAERELREAYGRAGLPFRHPTGAGNAWGILKPSAGDTPALLELKERVRNEVKRRLRHTVPIFLGGFFGFAALSIVLDSLFNR